MIVLKVSRYEGNKFLVDSWDKRDSLFRDMEDKECIVVNSDNIMIVDNVYSLMANSLDKYIEVEHDNGKVGLSVNLEWAKIMNEAMRCSANKLISYIKEHNKDFSDIDNLELALNKACDSEYFNRYLIYSLY